MENKRKHLEMIQGVISRQAANSFQTKSWAIALLAALVGLSRASKSEIAIAGMGVVLLFWLLDSYYLSSERKFRALYNHVRLSKTIDFALDPKPYARWDDSWLACFFRIVEILPYGAMLIGIIYFTLLR